MGLTRSNPKVWLVAGLAVLAVAVTLFRPPIAQWEDYHAFADARGFRHLPNALNVLSNLPFLLVGLLGLTFLARPSGSFVEPWERAPYALLMTAFVLVGLGSSYYHWIPNSRTLFWDRLPLALIFSSILGITVIERVDARRGKLLFLPLVLGGVASVIYWQAGNLRGTGDLRFYVLLQAGAVLAVPLMVLLFPPRYTGGRELLIVVALYGVAKLFELYDAEVYRLGGALSGHTLKHLFAGLAAWMFLRTLRRRRPVASRGEPSPDGSPEVSASA